MLEVLPSQLFPRTYSYCPWRGVLIQFHSLTMLALRRSKRNQKATKPTTLPTHNQTPPTKYQHRLLGYYGWRLNRKATAVVHNRTRTFWLLCLSAGSQFGLFVLAFITLVYYAKSI